MLTCKYSKFSLPASAVYLNCAYMSPLLKSVEKAGIRGVRVKRNPAAISSSDFFTQVEELKASFATLIGTTEAARIAIIPSVSYGLASVAKNLRIGKGQHVLVAAEQFPSNYYPWQVACRDAGAEVRVVAPEPGLANRGKTWNAKFLDGINQHTRAVAVAPAHWTDGTLFDLQALRKRTREVGALLIVDGTQSVGALPFDVRSVQPDALVCAAYKWLLGPYSIGLAYYGEYFDDGMPIEENWINRLDSDKFSGLVSYQEQYQPGAARYSMGEKSNFILVPMALKAINQLNRWGAANIQEYCRSITEPAIAALREEGFYIEELPHRASHLFGVRHTRGLSAEKLSENLKKARVFVSVRGDAIRVSPHVYNDEEDLWKLVRVLKTSL